MQGPAGELATTAPSLKQLDLTDHLIGSWSTVVSICQQLPHLQLLNLSLNRLQLPNSLPDAGLQQLPGLQCLVLNQCNITWQQVAVLQSSMQTLQELHVAGNSISSLHVQLEQPTQQQAQHEQQQDWPPLAGFRSLQVRSAINVVRSKPPLQSAEYCVICISRSNPKHYCNNISSWC